MSLDDSVRCIVSPVSVAIVVRDARGKGLANVFQTIVTDEFPTRRQRK
jgi:hypothetical protein